MGVKRNTVAYVLAGLADLSMIGIFAALGRSSHQETISINGLIHTAGPFWLGCMLGWVATLLVFHHHNWNTLPNFLRIWSMTLIVGMVIRWVIKGSFPPISFIIVAGISLAVLLGVWRGILKIVTAHKQ